MHYPTTQRICIAHSCSQQQLTTAASGFACCSVPVPVRSCKCHGRHHCHQSLKSPGQRSSWQVGTSLLALLQAAASAVATASTCRSDSVCSLTLQHTRAEPQFNIASNSRHYNICCPGFWSSVASCSCVVCAVRICVKELSCRSWTHILTAHTTLLQLATELHNQPAAPIPDPCATLLCCAVLQVFVWMRSSSPGAGWATTLVGGRLC